MNNKPPQHTPRIDRFPRSVIAPESDCSLKTSAMESPLLSFTCNVPSPRQTARKRVLCLPSLSPPPFHPYTVRSSPMTSPLTPPPPPFLREFPDCPWAWTQIETKKPGRKDVRLGTFSTLNFTATPRPFFFALQSFSIRENSFSCYFPSFPSPHPLSRAPVPVFRSLGS